MDIRKIGKTVTKRTTAQASKTSQRTTIDPLVRSYLGEAARDDQKAIGKQLRERVFQRLHSEGFKMDIPGVRAIQYIMKEARSKTGIQLDDAWSLAVRVTSIPPEANGYLLAVWKESLKLDRTFTVRQALWATRIKPALPGNVEPKTLLAWVTLYSARERLSEVKKGILNTDDLDAELAFWPSGKSFPPDAIKKFVYDQAVRTGRIPITQSWVETYQGKQGLLPSQGGESMRQAMRYVPVAPKRIYIEQSKYGVELGEVPDFFLTKARNILTSLCQKRSKELRELPPTKEGVKDLWDYRQKRQLANFLSRQAEWFDYAETVMVDWLRKISASVEKWKGIELSGVRTQEGLLWHRDKDEQTRKQWETEWNNMCNELAEWVIKEVQDREENGAGYFFLHEPTDILEKYGVNVQPEFVTTLR